MRVQSRQFANPSPPQLELRGTAGPRVDVHCHCLPGLDDGPRNMAGALGLAAALVADGVEIVVATPHQLGRYDGRYTAAEIGDALTRFNEELRKRQMPLTALPGADVRLDERLSRMIATGDVLTLANAGRHVLLELPHATLVDPTQMIRKLRDQGITPILTHPERHHALQRQPDLVRQWRRAGAMMQVTAGSLLGDFGGTAEQVGWQWLVEGMIDLVASDAHDVTRRPPRLSAAFEAIRRRLDDPTAQRICVQGPAELVSATAATEGRSGG